MPDRDAEIPENLRRAVRGRPSMADRRAQQGRASDLSDVIGPWRDLRPDADLPTDLLRTAHLPPFLQGCDLREANLSGARLIAIDLSLADLTGADLSNTFWSFVLAAYASFRGANLSGADLWQLKAYRCDFTGARFDRTMFRGVSAVECTFGNSSWSTAVFSDGDTTGDTAEARCFCDRFGIQIRPWFRGPCDFARSTGIPPEVLARASGDRSAG